MQKGVHEIYKICLQCQNTFEEHGYRPSYHCWGEIREEVGSGQISCKRRKKRSEWEALQRVFTFEYD